MKKKAIAILIATTLVMTSMVSLVGCKKDDGPKEPTKVDNSFKGTKIYKETNGKIRTINPHLSQTTDEGAMQGLIFASFVETFLDENKKPKEYPSMAKELISVSADKKVYTVKLREGLKFPDETPIDADAYIYSFKMVLDPQLKAPRAQNYFNYQLKIKGTEDYFKGKGKWEDVGIKAKDKYTLEFTTDLPIDIKIGKDIVNGFAGHLVNPKLYEKCLSADRKTSTYGTSLETIKDGCYGPYKMTEWSFDKHYKIEKDKNFPLAEKYSPDICDTRVVEEANTTLQLFEKGDVDFSTVTSASFEKYKEDPKVKYGQTRSIFQMSVNSKSTNTILADINMRKAIMFGVDRLRLAKDVLKVAEPAAYLIPKRFYVEDEKGTRTRYRDLDIAKGGEYPNNGFDKDKAKEYFEKAYAANGNKKIVVVHLYAEAESNKLIAEFLKKGYETVFGADKFEYKLQAMPGQAWQTNLLSGKYDISTIGWGSGLDYDPVSKLSPYRTKNNSMKADSFNSDEFDKLYERCDSGDLRFDAKAKLEAAAKLEKMVLDDATVIPLTEARQMQMYSDKLILPINNFIPGIGFGAIQATYTR